MKDILKSQAFENAAPILAGVMVAIIGFIVNLIMFHISQRKYISNKIVEQYLSARDELSKQLCILASLKTIEPTNIEQYIKNISLLFYKYYDILPQEVLCSLLCLNATLADNSNLYKFENNYLFPIDEDDYPQFVDSITIAKNTNQFIYYQLRCGDVSIQNIVKVSLQARKVLTIMNEVFSHKKIKSKL